MSVTPAPPAAAAAAAAPARQRAADAAALVALTLLAWLPLAWIGLHGSFPLSDDWAYARTVQTWLETGRFVRSAWTWAPSYTNAAVGAAFAAAFGFSHEVLRASGVAMGWVAVLATWALARTVGVGRGAAFLAAAAVALNPVHVDLSYTFMTDVPFAAFATLALAALAHGLRADAGGRRAAALALGGLLALAAVLSRAPGLALPLALGGAVLLTHPPRPRVWLAVGGAALLLLAFYTALPRLLYDAGDSGRHLRILWYLRHKLLGPDALYFLARSALGSAPLLGLFLLPVVAPRARSVPRPGRALAAGVALAAAGAAVAWRLDLEPPFSVNVIWNLGLGARSVPGREALPALPVAVWWGVSLLGLAAAGFALAGGALTAWARRGALAGRADLALLALFPGIYLGALAVQWPFFDRWLLPVLPPLLVLWLAVVPPPPRPDRAGRAVAAVALAVLGLYAVAGTRDAMELQRARWALLDDLVARGVSPARIDGGFEFNGWHHGDRDPSVFKPDAASPWVVDDAWRVTLERALPGYRRVAVRHAARLLPPGETAVYLHRRIGEPGASGAGSAAPEAPQEPAQGEQAEAGGGERGAAQRSAQGAVDPLP